MQNSDKQLMDSSATPVIQRVSPRSATGALSPLNKGAIDWGWQSFVAYGCHNFVVVVDTQHMKVFQTLENHKHDIVKVKWSKEAHYHDQWFPYNLKLASADTGGSIVIWNVAEATVKASFSDGTRAVTDLEWLSGNDSCQNFLAALHPPYSIIIWNTETGSKVWKKSYTEVLLSFSFDPFCDSNVVFLASDCILFVDDFSVSKVPSSNGRKCYISNPSTMTSSLQSLNTLSTGGSNRNISEEKSKPRSLLPRRMKFLIREESKSGSEEAISLNDCLQLAFHPAYRHHLLLLYPKEVLILDLEINQTIGIIAVERNGAAVTQMYPCWQREAVFCLHETGSVSLRVRHKGTSLASVCTPSEDTVSVGSFDNTVELCYDIRCQSDALRLTKHARLMGMAVCPKSECRVAVLISDGRLLIVELIPSQQKVDLPVKEKEELKERERPTSCCQLPYSSSVPSPCLWLSDMFGSLVQNLDPYCDNEKDILPNSMSLKFLITGYLNGLAPPPHVIRMCPPVTFRNWTVYKPLMAIGNALGGVQVFNMATGIIEREFSLLTAPVRGIEWVSLTAFLSYAYPNMMASCGKVRNELVLTDVQSGRTKVLRSEKNEESPIEMLRVSYMKQYFIIVFKEEPCEIWDLRTLYLLRIMPKTFPTITALEWSPLHTKKHHISNEVDGSDIQDFMSSFSVSSIVSKSSVTSKTMVLTREHFVFTDTDGQLYHFSVEGNVVRDGSKIPPDAGMGTITCIAWKSDHIVLGDVDGNLNLWDLKNKVSRGIPTHRGWIKKIRFGPGRGNLKVLVLFNDGVDLWDIKEAQLISQTKCAKDRPKVQDIDWAGSDRPVLATADGCFKITDINLKVCSSPLQDHHPTELPLSLHMLPVKPAFHFKSLLQHQPWQESYTLSIKEEDGFSPDEVSILQKQIETIDLEIQEYLKHCPFGIAERCLLVARLIGDKEAYQFWKVAVHYLKQEELALEVKTSDKQEEKDLLELSGDTFKPRQKQSCIDNQNILSPFNEEYLDTCFDTICDNHVYQKLQLERLLLHDSKRTTHSQSRKCAEQFLLLGQTDRAVQLLLEAETGQEHYYVDSLRACLIATIRSSGASQSVIKLVATNLIASGAISEGVELLCLIDKGSDACRYLQAAGQWEKSVRLAKVILPYTECQEVLKRWTDYLCSPHMNQKTKALLVLLSMGQFEKVLEMLRTFRMTERAALFVQACQEFGAIKKNEQTVDIIDTVLLDYARYLLSVNNRRGALHYCEMVGEKGKDLKKEIEYLCEEQ
ncbi:WD repeat-containing protein 11-like [Limulus polyphemus]|uniref:WD repeat-containing protein 11-like n=1 Tax=Limulus polyphemus TaxID=6850 RepID=A0ABM1B4C3_LIMPO|nr:WD repeat-containing protein 11-like [Limulus polyphemus]